MKNFSNIGNKLDITTKEYVDSKSPTALGGGAIIPGAEGVFAQITLDQIYANVFSNKKALRQVFDRVESGQMLVIGMTSDGSSGVFIQHITGTIENEVTSSTNTPYESGNKGVYHFIIAEKVTSEGISERAVIWAEKSGTAYSEYHSASQSTTEVFSTTVSEGWNTEYVNTETGLCNFGTLVGDGQIYWQLIQTALLRNDLGGTPQGNYFFAGSRFSIEYQSQLMQTTVLDRALGGDEDDGYFIDSINLNPNFLRSWVKYQTETAIGATITFNTKLKISTIGACLYNLFNNQLRSNSIVRELSESSVQFKIVPIVSSSADGNGDWTLCAMQLTINSITQYEIGEMSYPLTTTNPLDNFESVFDGTAWRNLSDTGIWTTNAGDRVAKYINFGALSLLHQYMMFGQYNIIKLSLKDMLEAQGRYALSVENDLSSQLATKYTKPSSGIPKSDLDSSVQASLDRVIPTVNDGTLTIQKNGTNVQTFTANQSGNVTANITVPTKVSELTNDSGFLTTHQDISGLMPKSGGTFTGEVKFGSTENFQGYYIKRMLGFLSAGTRYDNLDSLYKDGTYHRMWRLRFPSGSNFWGKIKITLYGNYSSFNASGVMSKSVTCNFNTSNIYNNVGCYDGLGVNVEQDFRISEAIWNATASAWEILIWQQHLNGNNSPEIMLECWTTNNTNYINAFNGITAQPVELTQSTSYSAQRASSTGGTKTVEWATLPVYETPLGEEIATVAMLEDKQDKITSSNKLSASLVSGLSTVATSGSYNDLSNKPTIPDVSGKANLDGGNTFTGKQTLNSPASDGYSINAAGYVKGSWLQASAISNKGANTGKVCVFDDSGWIYYRTPAEILTEAGGATTSDVSGKLDKTTYEVNKTVDFGSSGVLCVGKFKVYDTNVTCEVTSTTNVTYSGKLVIATQNNVIQQMTVYGDAANTVAPNFFIKPSTTSDPYIEIYFKPASWSKNVIHIYGSAISAEPTNVCTNVSAVPSTATSKPTNALNSKANLSGGNTFSGRQAIAIDNAGYVFNVWTDTIDTGTVFGVEKIGGGYSGASRIHIDGDALGNVDLEIGGDAGTAGQVLTSQGGGKTPQWKSMPTYSLSGTTLTITLP